VLSSSPQFLRRSTDEVVVSTWGQAVIRALWGTLLLCAGAGLVPEAAAQVRIFSAISKNVVGVGEAFTVDVDVYAAHARGEGALQAAMADARPAPIPDALELVRSHRRAVRSDTLDDGTPLGVVRWRYVWRATQPGVIEVPPLALVWQGRTWTAGAHTVTAYEVEPSFFEASYSILPVVAERRGAQSRKRYKRLGSAFLVAPDAAVTSLHVVLDARDIRLALPNGETIEADEAWVVDPARDVVLLHVDDRATREAGLMPLTIAPVREAVHRPGTPGVGPATFTYGWPGGVQHSTAGVRYPGVTLRPDELLWITSNAVRPGDSGGPLLDRHGRALGVVTSGTVRRGRPALLNEELCVATDFRPALGRKLLVDRPRPLKQLLRVSDPAERPHVQALRASTLLATRSPDVQVLNASLERLDADLQATPEHAQLHFIRGMMHQMLGTPEAAVASYRAALDAYEGHFLAAHMLGLSWLRGGRVDEAARMFRAARRYAPYAYHATYGLAHARIDQRQYEEALALLRTVLAHDAHFAPAYFEMARCLVALGRIQEARLLVPKLDDVDPTWGGRLRRMLREPALQPVRLQERPRAVLPDLSPLR
jgi:S1-C subfamily serine protease/Tfp pilus assembly protein PilF